MCLVWVQARYRCRALGAADCWQDAIQGAADGGVAVFLAAESSEQRDLFNIFQMIFRLCARCDGDEPTVRYEYRAHPAKDLLERELNELIVW